jgi:hypothetical protein
MGASGFLSKYESSWNNSLAGVGVLVSELSKSKLAIGVSSISHVSDKSILENRIRYFFSFTVTDLERCGRERNNGAIDGVGPSFDISKSLEYDLERKILWTGRLGSCLV